MTIEQKIETALVTFLKTQTFTDIPAAQIYRGIEHDAAESAENYTQTRVLPCIVCACSAASASDQKSGNRMANVEVTVRSSADDSTNAAHLTRCVAVFAFLADNALAAALSSAISDFYCFFCYPIDEGERVVDRSWESFTVLKMMVCPSDIS